MVHAVVVKRERGDRWSVDVFEVSRTLNKAVVTVLERSATFPGRSNAVLIAEKVIHSPLALIIERPRISSRKMMKVSPGLRFDVALKTDLADVSITDFLGAQTSIEMAFERALAEVESREAEVAA